MYEYHCMIEFRNGAWHGVVESYQSLQSEYPGRYGGRCYFGPARETQAEAGEDTRNWCAEEGIVHYLGPIISGMIGR